MEQQQSPLRKRDMGLAGAIIVLAQVLSSFQTSRNLSNEMDQLKSEFQIVRFEQEKYFVKKKELKNVIVKLDSMKVQLAGIRQQLRSIRHIALNDDDNIVGCSFKEAELVPTLLRGRL